MTRRSTPQAKLDLAAYPVQLRVLVPELGFGVLLNEIHDWLRAHFGKGEYATASASGATNDAICFMFRSTGDAHAFSKAFPTLLLADGTLAPAYSSPSLPTGRKDFDP
ncbi:hypothetical protein FGG78_42285, partial [Thioclava sp. BHET1]